MKQADVGWLLGTDSCVHLSKKKGKIRLRESLVLKTFKPNLSRGITVLELQRLLIKIENQSASFYLKYSLWGSNMYLKWVFVKISCQEITEIKYIPDLSVGVFVRMHNYLITFAYFALFPPTSLVLVLLTWNYRRLAYLLSRCPSY